MENANQSNKDSIFAGQKTTLPNATTVLVLGICSIVFSCVFVGLVLGIIGIVLSGKGRKMYKEAPALYEGYGQLNAGFIMSIIGTCIGALYTLYYVILVVIIGTGTSIWHMNNY
jgi:M penetrans paralogue family 26